MPGAKAQTEKLRPCPQYGAGFVRLNGSSACVRLGGQASFEYGVGGGRRGYSGTGTRSGVAVELDARTETDLGPLRAVVRDGGAYETGDLRWRPYN
ncbi:MAG: porin [Rhizobiales bacterium]|nr:porin [Hyphomicrobiales bacterium]